MDLISSVIAYKYFAEQGQGLNTKWQMIVRIHKSIPQAP